MALTIEPGVYLQELGGIRIEDTVALHQTGIEVLTPASKDLIVI
jgi:Xaa-Pro aminopeptidase